MADIRLDADSSFRDLKGHLSDFVDGGVLFCEADVLPRLLAEGAALLQNWVVIIHNGDIVDAKAVGDIARHCQHVFSVNWLGLDPRVSPLPIGLENLHHGVNGVLSHFDPALPATRHSLLSLSRDVTVLVAHSDRTNPSARRAARSVLRSAPGSQEVVGSVGSSEYFSLLKRALFVASPPGNGPDCHRTWEAMYLGAVPIVLSDSWPKWRAPLPALVVDTWEEALGHVSTDPDGLYRSISGVDPRALYFDEYLKQIFEQRAGS